MEPVALPACEVACPPRPREHELEPVPGPVGPARQHPRPLHVSLPEAPEIVEQADAVRVRVVLARRIVLEGKTINGEEKGGGEEEEEGYCMMIGREKKNTKRERTWMGSMGSCCLVRSKWCHRIECLDQEEKENTMMTCESFSECVVAIERAVSECQARVVESESPMGISRNNYLLGVSECSRWSQHRPPTLVVVCHVHVVQPVETGRGFSHC